MRAKVSTLTNVHCSAHCEVLAPDNATRVFLEFQMLDRFANKVYEWVGRSTNRRNELKQLLKDVFEVQGLQRHISKLTLSTYMIQRGLRWERQKRCFSRKKKGMWQRNIVII